MVEACSGYNKCETFLPQLYLVMYDDKVWFLLLRQKGDIMNKVKNKKNTFQILDIFSSNVCFTIAIISILFMIIIVVLIGIFPYLRKYIPDYITLILTFLFAFFTTVAILLKKPTSKIQENRVSDRYIEIINTLTMSHATNEENFEKIINEKLAKKNSVSVLETMVYNMAQIQNYYEISMRQAKNSYILAVVSSGLGIGFFIFASIMVLFFNATISSAIIPAIGGTLTEFIAGTVFIIYKKSLEQMNLYFSSLQSNEKFLSSVNLVEKVSTEKQDDIYCEIIRSRLDGVGSKQ